MTFALFGSQILGNTLLKSEMFQSVFRKQLVFTICVMCQPHLTLPLFVLPFTLLGPPNFCLLWISALFKVKHVGCMNISWKCQTLKCSLQVNRIFNWTVPSGRERIFGPVCYYIVASQVLPATE